MVDFDPVFDQVRRCWDHMGDATPGAGFDDHHARTGSPRAAHGDAAGAEPTVTEREYTRRHHFMGKSIDVPADLTEVQLDGHACIRCGAEDQPMRPVEAWSELSSQLFECVDSEACATHRGTCQRQPPEPS